jgi:class 3 adenylate cyclase
MDIPVHGRKDKLSIACGLSPALDRIEMKRRLAAILAADAVGYSMLMADDEAGTLTLLREHRRGRCGMRW